MNLSNEMKKLIFLSLAPLVLSSCPSEQPPPRFKRNGERPTSSLDRFLDNLELTLLDIAKECKGKAASCFYDKAHDYIEFSACKSSRLPPVFSSVEECHSEAIKVLNYVADGGQTTRRRRRSRRGGGGSGGGSSDDGGVCGRERNPLQTETLNSACPASGGSELTDARRLNRIAYFFTANSFRHEDFQLGGVGESDPNQDLILVFYMFVDRVFLLLNHTKLSADTGDTFYVYVGGVRQELSISGGYPSGGRHYGDDEVIFSEVNAPVSVGTKMLSKTAQEIHLAEEVGGSCRYHTPSGADAVSGACPASNPPSGKKLTDITFSAWGRYHKSDYSLRSTSSADLLFYDNEHPSLLRWLQVEGNKEFVAFDKDRIPFSSSKTYYMYLQIGSGAKTRYSLAKVEDEYCGENDIPHIFFEVEDGPDISRGSALNFWLAKEDGGDCVFYKQVPSE